MAEVREFFYKGEVSASKSLLNRALILKSFYPELKIIGHSRCDDVQLMEQAVHQWHDTKITRFECGAAGTVFRFLLARLAREVGEFQLVGEERLLSRPHSSLFHILRQLGCEIVTESKRSIRLRSKGWQIHGPIFLDLDQSSQYASALLLNAWNLPTDLVLQLGSRRNSYSYLRMTIEFLRSAGMEMVESKDTLFIPARQILRVQSLFVESDMSSVFSLAAIAASSGRLEIQNFPEESLQPDFAFLQILEQIGVPVEWNSSTRNLVIKRAAKIKPLKIDLSNNPDLFPVLAVLLSLADGESQISGIETLVHKESNRIAKTFDLLADLRFACTQDQSCFKIKGNSNPKYPQFFTFDPDQDHRMAMAAALAQFQGAKIEILSKDVVDKSFPEFWEILEQC